MNTGNSTSVNSILSAVEISYESGLHFVYAGNIPGTLQQHENTFCLQCKVTLIERRGFRVITNVLVNGCCPKCSLNIPGRWN